MINVYLNAEATKLPEKISLQTALKEWGYLESYFAIAINKNFIANSQYETTFLKEGDAIEVVTPMQGG